MKLHSPQQHVEGLLQRELIETFPLEEEFLLEVSASCGFISWQIEIM
jgi:hypothetical protein